jgi:hypothetical protein
VDRVDRDWGVEGELEEGLAVVEASEGGVGWGMKVDEGSSVGGVSEGEDEADERKESKEGKWLKWFLVLVFGSGFDGVMEEG